MPKLIDLTGRLFGRLTVTKLLPKKGLKCRYWECACVCGKTVSVVASSLKSGNTKSCGCLSRDLTIDRSTSHGLSGSKTYGSWAEMRRRCSDVSHPKWHRYGGRGIEVCDRWQSFENFLADMGLKPEGKTLDRIDNEGNYCLDNCKWSDLHEQAINRSKKNRHGFIGVTKNKQRFSSQIDYNGEHYHLGTYNTILEAAKAYDDRCQEIRGTRPNNT